MQNYFLTLSFLLCFTLLLKAQETSMILGDWIFHPNYTLERNAANYPGNKIDMPKSRFQKFKSLGAPIVFYDQMPSDRITNFLDRAMLPKEAFTLEMTILNHVNLSVGVLMMAKEKAPESDPEFLLGYYGQEAVFSIQLQDGSQAMLSIPVKRGYKKYWNHLVAVFDGQNLKLYLNGSLEAEKKNIPLARMISDQAQIEVAGYFEKEPYMKIPNLLKASRLYQGFISDREVEKRYEILKKQIDRGTIFPEIFHFNAGPYLHYATPTSINLLWETNQLATAIVEYGSSHDFEFKKKLSQAAYIQELTLDGLQAATPYYYQIIAEAVDGTKMKSGILTFGTAVKEKDPFSFCIIGDTESRPHINHRLGEMIWEERPNFVIHLGDVTDGGKQPHKFEWNQEYFTGIVPMASRIPIFPVPGNGEGDLYWYNRYHKLPAPEAYYKFQFGNAEFFMINSNDNKSLLRGGEQYEWLAEALKKSTAKWKFVAHHHCPVSSDENDFGDTWKGKASTKGDPRFDDLKKLYESAAVDAVFYGHVHAYERSYPIKNGQVNKEEGVIYIMSGGAGGHLEDFTPTRDYFSQKVQRGNHYCRVDIYDNTFHFKMYDTEGNLKDFLELRK